MARAKLMTEGSEWKLILLFTLPLMAGNFLQQLYNAVDGIVVGNFAAAGENALAAVGTCAPITMLFIAVAMGMSTGCSILIAQLHGARQYDEMRKAVATSLILVIAVGLVLSVVGSVVAQWLLTHVLKVSEDILADATAYFAIYCFGLVFQFAYNIVSFILRSLGDSAATLYFLLVSSVTNIVLDLVFVVAFDWGVAGVAYATIISQFASAVLVLVVLTRSDTAYGIKWRQIRIRRGMLGRIMAIGFPSGIQQAITSFSNVFVQSYINYFGSACMAGWSSYNKLDSYITVPLQAIALASTTFVGQNYGSNNLERTRKGVNQALGMSLVVTAALGVLVMIFSRPCLRLFTADAEVMEYGTRFIMIISPFYIMSCFNQIYAGALRGVGNANIPMIVMLGSFVVFRQVYLLVNRIAFDNSFLGVSLAYPMGWVVCSILLFICYRRSVICHPEKAKAKAVEEVAAE